MKTIATLTEADLGRINHEARWSALEERTGARAVVVDELSRIAVMHVTKMNYYKLPGGGIDDGESVEVALRRELKEEAGLTNIEIIAELGQTIEYREQWERIGINYCFFAQTTGPLSKPERTEKEIEQGYEVVWANDIDHAIQLVESGTPRKYGQDFERIRELAILKYAKATITSFS